jgi:hypothetical protein
LKHCGSEHWPTTTRFQRLPQVEAFRRAFNSCRELPAAAASLPQLPRAEEVRVRKHADSCVNHLKQWLYSGGTVTIYFYISIGVVINVGLHKGDLSESVVYQTMLWLDGIFIYLIFLKKYQNANY